MKIVTSGRLVTTSGRTARIQCILLRVLSRTGHIRRSATLLAHLFRANEAAVHLPGGGIFRTPLNDAYWVRVVVGWPYEPEVERAIVTAHALIPPASLLDCGANRGYWGARFASQMRVVGIEAVPSTFSALAETAAENNFTAVHAALWSESGLSLEVGWKPTAHAAASLVIPRGSKTASVTTVTLDNLYREYCAPDPAIVKLDVEGSELETLTGAHNVLGNCLLIYEDHGIDGSHRTTRMVMELGCEIAYLGARTSTRIHSVQDLNRIKIDHSRGYNFVAWMPGGPWNNWFALLDSFPEVGSSYEPRSKHRRPGVPKP